MREASLAQSPAARPCLPRARRARRRERRRPVARARRRAPNNPAPVAATPTQPSAARHAAAHVHADAHLHAVAHVHAGRPAGPTAAQLARSATRTRQQAKARKAAATRRARHQFQLLAAAQTHAEAVLARRARRRPGDTNAVDLLAGSVAESIGAAPAGERREHAQRPSAASGSGGGASVPLPALVLAACAGLLGIGAAFTSRRGLGFATAALCRSSPSSRVSDMRTRLLVSVAALAATLLLPAAASAALVRASAAYATPVDLTWDPDPTATTQTLLPLGGPVRRSADARTADARSTSRDGAPPVTPLVVRLLVGSGRRRRRTATTSSTTLGLRRILELARRDGRHHAAGSDARRHRDEREGTRDGAADRVGGRWRRPGRERGVAWRSRSSTARGIRCRRTAARRSRRSWNTTGLNGTYQVRAIATDLAGHPSPADTCDQRHGRQHGADGDARRHRDEREGAGRRCR